jgi:hypothetical protein
MTSLDPSATDPSTAIQDPAGDATSPAPATATAPVVEQTPPQGAFAPAPAFAPTAPAPHANGSPLAGPAPVGRIRGTGVSIALTVITLGIYSIVWFYKVHSEMKAHTGGAGLGGGLAAVLALFLGIVMPFVTSSEVGDLYRRAGMAAPVSGATGLWYFPGTFIVIGPLVWFIKTNAAVNSYWRSLGAV